MVKYILILAIALTSHAVFAQDDDTIQYHHGLPETGEDTSQQVPQPDFAPRDSFVEISPEQLPQELVKTLGEGPEFKGWQDGILLLDKHTGLYWIKLQSDSTMRTYRFTDKGKPVSVQEKDIQEKAK